MKPERFQRVDQLVSLALERAPGDRAEFIREASGSDGELRIEVERLVASYGKEDEFLAEAPAKLAAQLLTENARDLHRASVALATNELAAGRYQILEKLGVGGMGVVYAAYDPELERKVAIKLMHPEASATISPSEGRARLLREAQAMAQLSHPNVIAVHDVGTLGDQVFIAMEYVEGSTLSHRLAEGKQDWREVLNIFVQSGRGLAAAHAAGILHRDFKPDNVLIGNDGRVRVLDFGLARAAHAAAGSGQEMHDDYGGAEKSISPGAAMLGVAVTEPGKLMGTPAYMAPEQLMGQLGDARTDQFSFCVALYQGLYGELPFSGGTVAALLDQISQKKVKPTPLSVRVPARLRKVLLRGLSPTREARYESMDQLLQELSRRPPAIARWSFGALVVLAALFAIQRFGREKPNPEQVRSIVVLPLENLSQDPQQEYLADGMTDELITNLSKIGSLRVIARSSAMTYKSKSRSIPEIARELKVDAILEGTVLQSGDRLRIAASLIDANTQRSLWADSYEESFSDVLALQNRVARAVIAGIRVKLTPPEEISAEIQTKLTPKDEARLAKTRPVNPAAYEAYLHGQFLLNRRSVEETNKALKYFQQAIDIDPSYAQAYSGQADSYLTIAQYSGPKLEAWEKARAAVSKALELDDTLAEAHRSLARGLLWYDWDWAESEREVQRALQLNPGDAQTYRDYGVALAYQGRPNEAIAMMKRALELDPLSPQSAVNMALAYYFARQYVRAIEQARRAVELDPTFIQGHRWLGLAYAAKGKFPEAIDEFKLTVKLSPGNLSYLGNLARLYAEAGKTTEARQALGQIKELSKVQFISPLQFGLIYAALREKDEAFAWLDKAYEERNGNLIALTTAPWFEALRSDPRFAELVRRVEATTKLTSSSKHSSAK